MIRECPFCGRTHHSEYIEDLEEGVLACRDKAAREDFTTGRLEEFGGTTYPVNPELDALAVSTFLAGNEPTISMEAVEVLGP